MPHSESLSQNNTKQEGTLLCAGKAQNTSRSSASPCVYVGGTGEGDLLVICFNF